MGILQRILASGRQVVASRLSHPEQALRLRETTSHETETAITCSIILARETPLAVVLRRGPSTRNIEMQS